jgi:hypothetical protein
VSGRLIVTENQNPLVQIHGMVTLQFPDKVPSSKLVEDLSVARTEENKQLNPQSYRYRVFLWEAPGESNVQREHRLLDI